MTNSFRFYFLFLIVSWIQAYYLNPQYIALHKVPGKGWNQENPDSITDDGVTEILNAISTLGSPKRRLAFGFSISYNDARNETALLETLRRILSLSFKYNFPVILCLDGFEWWAMRSDLWNWFDPNQPGYNPENVYNVEWTDWNPINATTIGWRNWGTQIRVPQPHPNIMSPKFIKSNSDMLDKLVPVITTWYKSLPQEKKYLLGGLKLGWEINIGVNYYYYKNGNDLRTKDPKLDPTTGFVDGNQLGYAALKVSGIASSGTITPSMLDEVIRRYFDIITCNVYRHGIPRHKIYTHIGATFNGQSLQNVYSTPASMLSKCAQPGLSMYQYAYDASKAPLLLDSIIQIDKTPWGSVEWLYIGGNNGTISEQWEQAFENHLGYYNNRLVQVYNWDGIKTDTTILEVIKKEVSRGPKCLVELATLNETTFTQDWVILKWNIGSDVTTTYLLVSNSDQVLPSGVLANANIINEQVPLSTSEFKCNIKDLRSGIYYWMIVSDGCYPRQRMVSNIGLFSITS